MKSTVTFLTLNLLDFYNGLVHFPFLDLVIIIFRDIKRKNFTFVSQHYRGCSVFMDVQDDLDIYYT